MSIHNERDVPVSYFEADWAEWAAEYFEAKFDGMSSRDEGAREYALASAALSSLAKKAFGVFGRDQSGSSP